MKNPKNNRLSLIQSGSEYNRNLWRNNVALLLALLVMIFILPLIPEMDRLLTKVVLFLIVISGLFAAEFSKRIFKILSLLGALVLCLTVLDFFLKNSNILDIASFVSTTLFFIVVTIALVTHVARAKTADGSTIICAINSYLLIGLSTTLVVAIIDLIAPHSFSALGMEQGGFSSYLYFSFVTLTTLGYGDITPETPLTRSIATFTALFGQLYLVIIMALIIGKYLGSKGDSEEQKG